MTNQVAIVIQHATYALLSDLTASSCSLHTVRCMEGGLTGSQVRPTENHSPDPRRLSFRPVSSCTGRTERPVDSLLLSGYYERYADLPIAGSRRPLLVGAAQGPKR